MCHHPSPWNVSFAVKNKILNSMEGKIYQKQANGAIINIGRECEKQKS